MRALKAQPRQKRKVKGEKLPLLVLLGGKAKASKPSPLLHGNKGASLLEMTAMHLRVPPGFILTTEAYRSYKASPKTFFDDVEEELREGIRHLEEASGRTFGNSTDPLLLSIRSGAPVSMPGMMDTLLNVGLTRRSVDDLERRVSPLFAWSSFLRLISQFTRLVLKLPESEGLQPLLDLSHPPKDGAAAAKRCNEALKILEELGSPFPEDPTEQLWKGVTTVLESWENERARIYRKLQRIPETLGTACTIQAMVFGNRSAKSGTGVCFSRDPSTGERGISGEYLPEGQGEDVVAGIRTPFSLQGARDSLERKHPEVFKELAHAVARLERELCDVPDIEFTVEEGTLYFLQCRSAKRSAQAAIRIAKDMQDEGLLSEEEAIRRITPEHVRQLLRPRFQEQALRNARIKGALLAKGLPAGPGAATGRIVLCEEHAPSDEPWILVRRETSPEDVGAMSKAAGVLTSHGGMSSHAALVARQLGIVCVVGCEEATIDRSTNTVRFKEKPLPEGEWISLDGFTGEVFSGKIPVTPHSLEGSPLPKLLTAADRYRRLKVLANADTGEQAALARSLGAEGIGLARTEHMFLGDRLPFLQRLILSHTEKERGEALATLERLQRQDFRELLLAMDGLPVTVRTFDPPLHEFLPKDEGAIAALAEELALSTDDLRERISGMQEANPMMGLRGCRLGILFPEIPLMQVRALSLAACDLTHEGRNPAPRIMIPLTSSLEELRLHRSILEAEIRSTTGHDAKLTIPIGTMVEVPRAALLAEGIAIAADFLSFGTNDLTQLTFGISRDDASRFLPQYLEQGIYADDPFVTLDRGGVGALLRIACEGARRTKPNIPIGICGEHGGDPSSIEFCEELGLSSVSCSPYRVPVARLAAAQATLR